MAIKNYRSLSQQLTRRVLLLSLIGFLGLGSSIVVSFFNRLQTIQEQMDRVNTKAVKTFDLFFLDIQSYLIAAGDLLITSKDVKRVLLQIGSRYPSISELVLVDLQGNILAQQQAVGRSQLKKIDHPEWLKNPPSFGQVLMSSVSYENSVPHIDIAVTVVDEIGLPAQLLVAQVDLTELWNKTLEVKVGKTGYVYITEREGRIVTYRNGQVLAKGSSLATLVNHTPEQIAQSRLSFYRGLSHQWVVASGQRLTIVPWFTVVEQPASEALAPFFIPAALLLLVLVIVMVLLYSIVRFTQVRIVSPLLLLSRAVKQMKKGQALPAIALTHDDELAQLANSLVTTSQENAQLYISLEDKVEERTQALQQEISKHQQTEIALQKAKEAADSANLAKSEFLANMSHELRTPLNGILGYAQILQNSELLTERGTKGVDIIYQCGNHLLNLINDVLDLAKIEVRKLELSPGDLYFPAFLENIAEMMRLRASQKEIHFTYQLDCDLPVGITVDEKRLRQVLINLLSNAIKFTDQGRVAFRIKSHKLDAASYQIRFEVEDTGVGISPEELTKIFQPFEQVGDVNKQAEGTGLGLAISQQIVSLMSSTLEVESQLGQGSIFWFEVELPEAKEWPTTLRTTQQGTIVGFKGAKYKVLVVDDRWENRSVVVNLLEPLGFEVIEASNGKEGLEKTNEIRPDLIITDLMMPEMDGYEMLRQLRQVPKLKDIPAIASSASVFKINQSESIDAGANSFLPKPIEAPVLLKLLKKYLNLEWIYDNNSIAVEGVKFNELEMSLSTPAQIIPPPDQVLSELHRLALQGRLMAIEQQLKMLEKADEQYQSFVKKVRQLAARFQVEEIQAFVEQYLPTAKS